MTLHRKNLSVLIVILLLTDLDRSYIFNSRGTSVNAASNLRGNDWKDLFLTNEEKTKLDAFKEQVLDKLPEDFMKSDVYLIKWLRAKNFVIDDATNMLMENVRWRQENKIKDILSEDFHDISEDYHMQLTTDTHDKKDRPVGTVNFGSWNVRLAVMQGKVQRLCRFLDRFEEKLFQQVLEAQQSGKQVTRVVVLLDMEGMNMMQHLCPSCITVFIRLVSGIEAHYPGLIEELIFVNTPGIFNIILNAIQGVMSPETRNILKVFDTNKSQWKAYLDERIDSDQRYTNFGGTIVPYDHH